MARKAQSGFATGAGTTLASLEWVAQPARRAAQSRNVRTNGRIEPQGACGVKRLVPNAWSQMAPMASDRQGRSLWHLRHLRLGSPAPRREGRHGEGDQGEAQRRHRRARLGAV